MKLSPSTLQRETKQEKTGTKMFLKVQEAIKICEKALESNQDNVEILYNLGKCYLECRDYDKLKRITDSLRKKERKSSFIHILDGHWHLKQGHPVESYQCFTNALSVTDNNDPFLVYGMALLYENMEYYSSAINWYTQVLKFDLELFKFIEIVYRIGICLKKENKLVDSLNVFQTLCQLSKSKALTCDIKIQLAHVYEKMNNDEKSIEILNELKLTYNKTILIYRLLGWISFKHKQYTKVKELEENIEGQDPYTLYLIARSYLIDNNKSKAIELLKRCISLDQDMFMAHNTLGIIYYKSNQVERAIMCFKRAINIRHNMCEFVENIKAIESVKKKYVENLSLREIVPDLNKTKYLDSQVLFNEIVLYPTTIEKNVIKEINCANL